MRISDVSIDLKHGDEAYTVYVHNMSPEDFDKWEDKMTSVRTNRRGESFYRSGHLNIGGLGLTIFEEGL